MNKSEVTELKKKFGDIKDFMNRKIDATAKKQVDEKIESLSKNTTVSESLLHYIDQFTKSVEDSATIQKIEFSNYLDGVLNTYLNGINISPDEKAIPLTKAR